MVKYANAQLLIYLMLGILLYFLSSFTDRTLRLFENQDKRTLALYMAESKRRSLMCEFMLKEDRQYCDGVPWQEDTAWCNARWDALHEIFISDSITFRMLEHFRKGNYFKINLTPIDETQGIELNVEKLPKHTAIENFSSHYE